MIVRLVLGYEMATVACDTVSFGKGTHPKCRSDNWMAVYSNCHLLSKNRSQFVASPGCNTLICQAKTLFALARQDGSERSSTLPECSSMNISA